MEPRQRSRPENQSKAGAGPIHQTGTSHTNDDRRPRDGWGRRSRLTLFLRGAEGQLPVIDWWSVFAHLTMSDQAKRMEPP